MKKSTFKEQILDVFASRLDQHIKQDAPRLIAQVGMVIATGTVMDDLWWEARKGCTPPEVFRELVEVSCAVGHSKVFVTHSGEVENEFVC